MFSEVYFIKLVSMTFEKKLISFLPVITHIKCFRVEIILHLKLVII